MHILPVYLTQEEYASVSENSKFTPQTMLPRTSGGHLKTTSSGSEGYENPSEVSSSDPSNVHENNPNIQHNNSDVVEHNSNENLSSKSEEAGHTKTDITAVLQPSSGVTTTSSSDSATDDTSGHGPTPSMVAPPPLVITSDPIQIMKNIKAVASRNVGKGVINVSQSREHGDRRDALDRLEETEEEGSN